MKFIIIINQSQSTMITNVLNVNINLTRLLLIIMYNEKSIINSVMYCCKCR